ncbi:DUF3820 family protein [Accumulibacter sp.]|uniref:putative quorum-sensing-regulated virulence factor n=1 Tax=Accumulibacter sp. TaxID=2053492 RepID=UPI0025FA200B|nr:DUF3820 family protein [Accumulibacter sp.]MCP5228883.1 DUF3820 family protein [Accumulibacter sp.]
MNSDDLPLLLTWSMSFSKYKGCLIADLPGSYLNWFPRQGLAPGPEYRVALDSDDVSRGAGSAVQVRAA